jgi:L-fuculose-phosphate aldolase
MNPGGHGALRTALLRAARAMNRLGINHGKAGNVSVRCADTGRPGFLITPSGMPYTQTQQEDLVWIALDRDAAMIEAALGEADPGSAEPLVRGLHQPSSEWRFHRDILATRPEVNAVVHTHAGACAALSCLERVQREGIPAFHYMIAAAGGRDLRCAPYATFGTAALSQAVLGALEGRRACLMAHHGMIALGSTLDAALALAVEVEWLAATYSRVLTLGEPQRLDDAEMDRVIAKFATYGKVGLGLPPR